MKKRESEALDVCFPDMVPSLWARVVRQPMKLI